MVRLIRIKLLFLVLVGLVIYPFERVQAHEEPTDPIDQVSFEQKLDAQVPLFLRFNDEHDQEIDLKKYFKPDKPVILLFAYYECQMLCPVVLEDLAKTLKKLPMDAGNQFEIITVSFDPSETASLAMNAKEGISQQYGRPEAMAGWHFLTGEEESILNLADSIGLHYSYDEEIGEYLHPTGLVILTPEGKISRYIFGVDYTATDLRLGLVEASSGKIGNAADKAFLLCYRYNPVTGRYSFLISNVIRIMAVVTVILLAAIVLGLFLKERASMKDHVTRRTNRSPKETIGSG